MRLFRRIPRRRFKCIQVNVPLRSDEMERCMKRAYLASCQCSCFSSSAQAHRYLVAGKGVEESADFWSTGGFCRQANSQRWMSDDDETIAVRREEKKRRKCSRTTVIVASSGSHVVNDHERRTRPPRCRIVCR